MSITRSQKSIKRLKNLIKRSAVWIGFKIAVRQHIIRLDYIPLIKKGNAKYDCFIMK